MNTENKQKQQNQQELDPRDQQMVKDIRRFSVISALFGVLTLFMALMALLYGWSILYVLAPALPCLLFNGGARTLRQRLQSRQENRGVFQELEEEEPRDEENK